MNQAVIYNVTRGAYLAAVSRDYKEGTLTVLGFSASANGARRYPGSKLAEDDCAALNRRGGDKFEVQDRDWAIAHDGRLAQASREELVLMLEEFLQIVTVGQGDVQLGPKGKHAGLPYKIRSILAREKGVQS